MALVQAPALSLHASGKLAGAIVFATWKGRPYVRSLVTPANPKSGGQVGMRAMFKFLTQDWTNLTAAEQATWENRADADVISPFNAFISYNQFRARNFKAPSQEDPAAEANTHAVIGATVATAGVRSITIDVPITTLNDGWAVNIYRSTSTGFSTAYDNLIGVLKITAAATFTWVDSPLAAGTYYYNFRGITDDGLLNTEDGEINATVT